MSALKTLSALTGAWQGLNQLWLYPGDPVHESESLAEINAAFQEQFTALQYTWAEAGKPQAGCLMLTQATEENTVKAVWFDTWHMAHQFMVCEGSVDDKGVISVTGSYAAPPSPDWGWQIDIEPKSENTFHFRMYNITPDGEKFLAVKVTYTRQA